MLRLTVLAIKTYKPENFGSYFLAATFDFTTFSPRLLRTARTSFYSLAVFAWIIYVLKSLLAAPEIRPSNCS